MKIAFIHPDYPESEGTGATHSATQIISCAKSIGHEVTCFCTTEPPNHEDISCQVLHPEEKSRHTATGLNKSIASNVDLFKNFDIIHSYLPRTIPSINYIGKNADIKTAVTLNSFGGVCPKNDLLYMGKRKCRDNSVKRCLKCSIATSGGHAKFGAMHRSASRLGNLRLVKQVDPKLNKIDKFQALSGHVKSTYSEFGFPKDRIQTIPNIINDKFFIRHESDFSDPYQLLYVGSLERHKGVNMLPDIISHLNTKSEIKFELNIVGSGGLDQRLKDRVHELDVERQINFTGHVSNNKLPEIYSNHDLFVYPGIWDEPFGRVFIEALAAGTPVVGTNVGAVSSIVGSAGVTSEPDAEALADKINHLFATSEVKELAGNTKMEAQRFSANQVEEKFSQFYEFHE